MFAFLFLLLAAAQSETPPLILTVDPPQGPMPGENRTLSQPHRNQDLRMFPDLAIRELRIDGDTLYVLVGNVGAARADGAIRLTARAETNGVRSGVASASVGKLRAGEARWVPMRNFAVKSASASPATPFFALERAGVIAASVSLSPGGPTSTVLNRTGQGCDRCLDLNEANNSLAAPGAEIRRGRPD